MPHDGLNKTIFDLTETIKQTVMITPHRAGWPFIIGFAIASLLISLVWDGFVLIGLVLTLWCIYFFRDPARIVPTRDGLIISPADGRVTDVTEGCALPRELSGKDEDEGDYTRISIFLSVFNVHVNRIPVSGVVKKLVYKPGLFLNAGDPRASFENERCAALITHESGKEFGVVQIAGLIARRILCDIQEGQDVKKGERYGIIRFGSRVDIYLPEGVAPMVAVGQTMIGGETVLADFMSSETARDTQVI
jgi:phosphatidylserine decarboxylase